MSKADSQEGLMSALTTEHFVMQGAISSSVSEQQARASMFLYFLSGALVAIGFLSESKAMLPVVATILFVLFVSGLLTTLRLIDIGMESLQSHVMVARIRAHYRSLGGTAKTMFDPGHGRWPEGRTDSGRISGPFLGLMTTAASMIACVNGVVGGSLVALLLHWLAHLSLGPAIGLGALFALVKVAGFYLYQGRRIARVSDLATEAGLRVGDDRGPSEMRSTR